MIEPLSDGELLLIAGLLDSCIEVASNQGCNDLPEDLQLIFSASEWDQLDKDLSRLNICAEEDHTPGAPNDADWVWMLYCANRIREVLSEKYGKGDLVELIGGAEEVLKRRALSKLSHAEIAALGFDEDM